MKNIIPEERIEKRIFYIRGRKVMIDYDLAQLYEVKTKRLNEQVKRNIERFPDDFMFQLSGEEFSELISNFGVANLKSQNATSRWGGRRKMPYAFTEQGVAMLSSILKSKRAIHVNIQIMRTFTKLKRILLNHDDLRKKVEEMEKKYDHRFKIVFDVIKQLMSPPVEKVKKIGFLRGGESDV